MKTPAPDRPAVPPLLARPATADPDCAGCVPAPPLVLPTDGFDPGTGLPALEASAESTAAKDALIAEFSPRIQKFCRGELSAKEARRLFGDLVRSVDSDVTKAKSAWARGAGYALEAGRISGALMMLGTFLVGIRGLSDGIKMIGSEHIDSVMRVAENPFTGVMVGLLATGLLQSSIAVTSVIVGLVAAGTLTPAEAIPMVMGSNIGTTSTSTIAALFNAGKAKDFEKSFSAATIHDIFNVTAVGVLLTAELQFGLLEKASKQGAEWILGTSASGEAVSAADQGKNLFFDTVQAGSDALAHIAQTLTGNEQFQAGIVVALSLAAIFGGLRGVTVSLQSSLGKHIESILTRVKNPIASASIGAGATVATYSSSLVTSLLVPMAAAGVITLPQTFAVTVGANLGATSATLQNALAESGPHAHAALEVALAHTGFNLAAASLLLVPGVAKGIIGMAEQCGKLGAQRPTLSGVAVATLFVGMPSAWLFGPSLAGAIQSLF